MRIVYLLPVAPQARYQKRVAALQALGVEPRVMAFERDYYPGKPWPQGYTSLGTIEHVSYAKRLGVLGTALPLVRAAVQRSDAAYAFSLDTLFLGWLATRTFGGRKKIIYELGDTRPALLGKGLVSRGLRSLARLLLRDVDHLVVTSEAFVTGYFQGVLGLNGLRYQVIENKLDGPLPTAQDVAAPERPAGRVRIGYFGLIRCRRSLEILTQAVAAAKGQVQLYMRGIPFVLHDDLGEIAQSDANVEYGGSYVVPDDLPSMYGQVDMAWACYPYQGTELGNWMWARTNRFYEACYFGRPMFAQKGTEDGRVVESLGLGVTLDLSDVEGTVDRILQIRRADITQWRDNMNSLPEEVYMLSREHEQLLAAIHRSYRKVT